MGIFYPQGESHHENVGFSRWREGDGLAPCDPDYPLRDYAYISNDLYRPFDFWEYQPSEWASLSIALGCTLRAIYNPGWGFSHDLGIEEQIISNLCLRPLNDTTFSFVPAKGEYIDFQFIYSTTMGLTPQSDVYLKVQDCYGVNIYTSEVPIPPVMECEPNQWDLPFLDWGYMINVNWNGRNNQDYFDLNRLAEPNDDPHMAYIFVDEGPGMVSNVDTFNVVPYIDSVLITHTPSYPPPTANQTTTLYTLARARIHDTGDPSRFYRYYFPPGAIYPFYPEQLEWWNGSTYRFWDLPGGAQKKYFEHIGDWYPPPVGPIEMWRPEHWGDLAYKWLVE